MKLAFCLFKYFPFGGLQRDFLRIAQACQRQGYQIHVYTMDWQGDIPVGFNITQIPVKGMSNHRRCLYFAQALQDYLSKGCFDAIVGFNRLPGLDIYFAGDLCYEATVRTKRSWFYRLTPRYRTYAHLEQVVFHAATKTRILLISEREKQHYQTYYGTPSERFYLLPAGIAEDRKPLLDNQTIRQAVRDELGVKPDDNIVLMVGSSFATKGVDRALLALAALPKPLLAKTILVNIGEGKAAPYRKMAKRFHIADKVQFLGPRHDVSRFFWAADMLIHPSYYEAGGMVLLEALVSGLPILVTANCGYAYHVQNASAGMVVDMPFVQERLNAGLLAMLDPGQRAVLRANALAYADNYDFYQFTKQAVAVIEDVIHRPAHRRNIEP